MTGSDGSASPLKGSPHHHDPILRAKYLDYCSARVAEALLTLSPDEIFLLAEDAVRGRHAAPASPLSYDEMVQLATGRISTRLELPGFEAWAEAYREDPERFDREMLGMWETELDAER